MDEPTKERLALHNDHRQYKDRYSRTRAQEIIGSSQSCSHELFHVNHVRSSKFFDIGTVTMLAEVSQYSNSSYLVLYADANRDRDIHLMRFLHGHESKRGPSNNVCFHAIFSFSVISRPHRIDSSLTSDAPLPSSCNGPSAQILALR